MSLEIYPTVKSGLAQGSYVLNLTRIYLDFMELMKIEIVRLALCSQVLKYSTQHSVVCMKIKINVQICIKREKYSQNFTTNWDQLPKVEKLFHIQFVIHY